MIKFDEDTDAGRDIRKILDEENISCAPVYYSRVYVKTPGDKMGFTAMDGKSADAKPSYYLNHLTRLITFMSNKEYKSLFGENVKENAFIVDLGDKDVKELESKLNKIEGDTSYDDFKEVVKIGFQMFSKVSVIIVIVYTALAIVMAALVLINLYVMFVNEKKRHLTA